MSTSHLTYNLINQCLYLNHPVAYERNHLHIMIILFRCRILWLERINHLPFCTAINFDSLTLSVANTIYISHLISSIYRASWCISNIDRVTRQAALFFCKTKILLANSLKFDCLLNGSNTNIMELIHTYTIVYTHDIFAIYTTNSVCNSCIYKYIPQSVWAPHGHALHIAR